MRVASPYSLLLMSSVENQCFARFLGTFSALRKHEDEHRRILGVSSSNLEALEIDSGVPRHQTHD